MKSIEEIINEQLTIKTVYYSQREAEKVVPSSLFLELEDAGVECINLDEVQLGVSGDNIILPECKKRYAHSLLLAGTDNTLECFKNNWIDKLNDIPLATVGFSDAISGCDIYVEDFDEVDLQFLDRIEKRAGNIPWTAIITDRCILKEQTLEDLDELYEMYEYPGFTDFTPPLFPREQEEEYTKRYIDYFYRFYGFGLWIVRDRETDRFIGRCGFGYRTVNEALTDGAKGPDEDIFDIGYSIAHAFQGRGLATEICKKLVEYARDNIGLGELSCFIYPGNEASMHIMDKLGFSFYRNVYEGSQPMREYRLVL